jgi:S-adenosylmethionine:tRNA ribosyltransferase-isomerase
VKIEDFDYPLPPERIAQRPLDRREDSRLLVVRGDRFEHARFADLPEHLVPGTVLVINDSAVILARLVGRKVDTGGGVEILCVRPITPTRWTCLAQSSKPLRVGTIVDVDGARLTIVARGDDLVEVDADCPMAELIARAGRVPLPPYIRRDAEPEDESRYQTVYAREAGSVAAPTAGLHFTADVLGALAARGVELRAVTLHVGPGTFLPVRGAIEDHHLVPEAFCVPDETRAAVLRAREGKRPVIAVGTTTVRALETWAKTGRPDGDSDLLILPGHEFRAVTGLLTNFHHPKTTLLLLVAALGGQKRVLAAYQEALARGYRFLSYGDAMLLP